LDPVRRLRRALDRWPTRRCCGLSLLSTEEQTAFDGRVVSALPVDLEQHRSRRCHFLRAEAYALLTFEVVEIVSLLSWVSDSLDKRRVLARTCVRISARTSTSNPPRHGSRQSSHREDHVIGILHCVPSDACVQASGRCLAIHRAAKPFVSSCPHPRWRALMWTDRHRSARDSGLYRIQPTIHSRVHRSHHCEHTYERARSFNTPDTLDTTTRFAVLRGVAVS
jgi:hypothetical protein